MNTSVLPVVLFAYARPTHLARVLACLRENAVPLVLAYADGAKGSTDAPAVAKTRTLLRGVDWAEIRLTERTENLGLGRNVLAGVTEAASRHETFIVWEDDLVCVPGTYDWLCGALRHYALDERVMSVTAWTHPRVTPADVGDQPSRLGGCRARHRRPCRVSTHELPGHRPSRRCDRERVVADGSLRSAARAAAQAGGHAAPGPATVM